MQEVIGELQRHGNLDVADQTELVASLKQLNPVERSLALQSLRARLAYRRQTDQPATATIEGGQFPPPPAASMATATPRSVARRPGQPAPVEARSMRQPTNPNQRRPGERPVDVFAGPRATDAATSMPIGAAAGNPPQCQPASADAPLAGRPFQGGSTSPSDSRVVPVSCDSPVSEDWQASLAPATRALESRLRDPPQTPAEVVRHAQLRMLYLLAGRREDAMRPISSIAPAVQEFWSKELFGLATWLDVERSPDPTARAAETKQILSDAAARLGEAGPLVVCNLAFCSRIDSYGCIEPFPKYEFAPDQEVLIYAELENFASESTPKGFHTALQSSYQIFDAGGRRVAEHDFTTTEEYCRNCRRDFFIGYHLRLPKRIYPGRHTLKLTIKDLKSGKVGQSSIALTIADAAD